MTVMFTIDPTTNENGCLEVVPGSHKNSYESRILPQETSDQSISLEWCGQNQWIPVHCKPVSETKIHDFLKKLTVPNVPL